MSTPDTLDARTASPMIRPELKRFDADGMALLLRPATGDWTVVTGVGREVVSLCDGSTCQEIATAIAARYGAPLQAVLVDVRRYLADLGEHGLLMGTEAPTPVPARAMRGEIALHLTNACNLSCRHCYADAGPDNTTALPPGQARRLLEVFGDGSYGFVFSGGEPLLHPDWRDLVRHAAGISTAKIITNATLLAPEDAAWLAAHGVRLQISLDGTTPCTHDWLRGSGAFVRARDAVETLVAVGHGSSVVLCCTLHARNRRESPRLLDLAREWGVGGVHFVPVSRHGRAAGAWPELALSSAVAVEVYRELSERRWLLGQSLEVTGCVGDFVERSLFRDGLARCPIGENIMVEAGGDAYPCILLTAAEYRLGDCRDLGPAALAASPARRRAIHDCAERVTHVPECAGCDWRALCQGACAGSALWRTGSIHATDGLCDLRRQLFVDTIFLYARRKLDLGSIGQ